MYKNLLISTLFLFHYQPYYFIILHTFFPASRAQCTEVAYHSFAYISPRAIELHNIVHFATGKYNVKY